MDELDKSGILAEGLYFRYVDLLSFGVISNDLENFGNILPGFRLVQILQLYIHR